MTLAGKRTPDEEKAFRANVAGYFRQLNTPKVAVTDERGKTVYVIPERDSCPDCIDGMAYHPDYGLYPCPTCRASTCRVCGGTGMFVPERHVSDPEFGKAQLCPLNCAGARRVQAERTAKLYAGARLPEGYQDCTLASFKALVSAGGKQTALWHGKMLAYYAVEAFIGAADSDDAPFGVDYAEIVAKAAGAPQPDAYPDVRNSLVFYGPHGVGKTGFAAAIVNALVPQGYAVRYSRTQDFISAVQRRYRDSWTSETRDDFGDLSSAGVVDVVRQAPVLILDEFDMPDADTEDKQGKIESVIRFRCNHLLPTIVTTNLDYAALEGRWGTTTMVVLGQRAHFIPVSGTPLRPTPQSIPGAL